MPATIKDIARTVGVSVSTVSRALTAPALVKADTRARIEQAASALGYQPNRAARGLTTGRTGNIGLVVSDLTNPFFPSVVKGVQDRAREFDHSVLLTDTGEDPAVEARLIRALSGQVDGIVLCSSRLSDDQLRSVAGTQTMVLLNRRVDSLPAVTIDNSGAFRETLAYLSALGHRRVAYVAGPPASWSNQERVRGLRAGAAATGLQLVEVGPAEPHFAGGVATADAVVATGVTAVVTYNDLMALGLLSRLRTMNVTTPGDISVIGVDDIMFAEMSMPSLTTLQQPKEQMGRAGVDLLTQLFHEPGRIAASRALPARLIVRNSTGKAPAAA